MDEMQYEAMRRRIAALESRLNLLEKKLSEENENGGVRELRKKFPIHLNKTDTANVLGVTRATVYAMIADGRLEENAAGKVKSESLIKLLTGPTSRKYGAHLDEKGG